MMKTFEVHITGEKGINKEFDVLGYKNIVVELLKPNRELLRTEYMSSYIIKFETYEQCLEAVLGLTRQLKSKIIRVKIECPVYPEYIKQSIYIETHFIAGDSEKRYPLSRNKKSGKIMGTYRVYDKNKYNKFIENWENEDKELCLFDTFVEEDFDWFKEYGL